MPDSPVLSYKKPSQNNNSSRRVSSSVPSTPNLSQPDSPIGSQHFQSPSSIDSPRSSISTIPTTRKVSSRRKALQEFYHLNQNNNHDDDPNSSSSSSSQIGVTSVENLDISNPENIENMIKNSPIEDILKLRNSLSSKLNSSNQTKKSIIYDNYYELIKLSNTLADLSTARLPSKKESNLVFKLYTDDDDDSTTNKKEKEMTKEEYVDKTLDELSDFVSTEGDKFNGSFKEVLDKLNSSVASDSASILTLRDDDDDNDQLEQSEKQKIIDHINYILDLPNQADLDDTTKEEAIQDIKNILQENPDNELLALQLTKIENTLL
ncbi:hypothetical protein CTRG_05391 [Candida tropicalis MYA-3404]|uniref:Vacuolar protein sorting-associated protein 51 homolog n=1 Tax=Candida tropicalis (strain ATCC MYA-3404 / T1) TaxID=294747 RepID=C5MH37_CANTT|nr:hypothetical protein CTRG_05391 [Candida tropicalis MYA-3404]EER30939.1 hypothetical protein CTRG_05391 [Candida tropicalis MYA-3404]KAG4404498.1 hypothetical protein JTP64_006251 [Candida tropicalis]